MVKNPPANAEDMRCGFDPGIGGFLEEGIATHSSILAWKIPLTEEPGRLWSIGLELDTTEVTKHAHAGFSTLLAVSQSPLNLSQSLNKAGPQDSALDLFSP